MSPPSSIQVDSHNETIRQRITNELNKHSNFSSSWLWKLFILALLGNMSMYYFQYVGPFIYGNNMRGVTCIPPGFEKKLWSDDEIKNVTLPDIEDYCNVYDLQYEEIFANYSSIEAAKINLSDADIISCVDIGGKFKFVENETLTAEFGLACEKEEVIGDFVEAIYIGLMLGSLIIGVAGDKFGRKKIISIASIPFAIASFLLALAPSTTAFTYLNIPLGICSIGITNLLQIQITENLNGKCREVFAILFNFGYPLVFGVIFVISKVSSQWRELLMCCAIVVVIFMMTLNLIVESPRYLLSKGDLKKAYKQVFGEIPSELEVQNEMTVKKSSNWIKNQEIFQFFFTSHWKNSLIFVYFYCLCWFTYDFILNSSVNYQTDLKTQSSIFAATDAVGFLLVAITATLMTRRRLEFILFAVMGLMIVLGSFNYLENPEIYQIFFYIARGIVNPTLAILSLHIIEVYPTEIRSTAMGMTSFFAVVTVYFSDGAINFYESIQEDFSLPNLKMIIGLIITLSSCLIFILPETKNLIWDDKIEEKVEISQIIKKKSEKSTKLSNSTIVALIILQITIISLFLTYFL